MPRTALFPGSFDPVTNGHVDIVAQAARLAERLVLAVGTHPGKTPLFSADERLAMLNETCAPVARKAGCELRCRVAALVAPAHLASKSAPTADVRHDTAQSTPAADRLFDATGAECALEPVQRHSVGGPVVGAAA